MFPSMRQFEIRPSPARADVSVDLDAVGAGVRHLVPQDGRIVRRVRDVDAVLARGVDDVVLDREIQREAREDAVVPAGDVGSAVVVGVAVLDDDAARVAAVVRVAEDGDTRSRRARDLEPVEGDVAARRELDEVLGSTRWSPR